MKFFKKDSVEYEDTNKFFLYNENDITFNDIKEFYFEQTRIFTNAVYERAELLITLVLENSTELSIRADTTNLEYYKMITKLRDNIEEFRRHALHERFLRDKSLQFSVKNDSFSLLFENENLYIHYVNNHKEHKKVKIDKVIQNKQTLQLFQKDSNVNILLSSISDSTLFLLMAHHYCEFISGFETMQKRALIHSKWRRYFYILFTPFALNGLSEIWFDTSLFKGIEAIESISILSGILLGIWIVTAPIYYLVYKLNGKKLQKEQEYLS